MKHIQPLTASTSRGPVPAVVCFGEGCVERFYLMKTGGLVAGVWALFTKIESWTD